MKRYLVTIVFVGLFAPIVSAETARNTTVYTALDPASCVTTAHHTWDEEPGMAYFTMECPALGGYQVIVRDVDARTWIDLRKGAMHKEFLKEMIDANLGAFPHVGEGKLEWLMRVAEGEAVPYGLIFRVTATDHIPSGRKVSRLFAVRLDGEAPCLVGITKTVEDARQLVRGAQGCLVR